MRCGVQRPVRIDAAVVTGWAAVATTTRRAGLHVLKGGGPRTAYERTELRLA
jgi:hypothetical protein